MLSPQFTPERSIFDEFFAIECEFKEMRDNRDLYPIYEHSEDSEDKDVSSRGSAVRKLDYGQEDKEEEPPAKRRAPVKGMGLMCKFS